MSLKTAFELHVGFITNPLTERYSVTENCWAVRRFRKEWWLIHLLKGTVSLKTAVLFDVFARNGDWSTPATYWKVLCHWKPLCCLTFSQAVVTDPLLKLIERCHWCRRFHKELWLIHTCSLLKNRVSVETAVVFDVFKRNGDRFRQNNVLGRCLSFLQEWWLTHAWINVTESRCAVCRLHKERGVEKC